MRSTVYWYALVMCVAVSCTSTRNLGSKELIPVSGFKKISHGYRTIFITASGNELPVKQFTVSSDSVVLITGKVNRTIAISDIRRIRLSSKTHAVAFGAFSGLLVGAAASGILIAKANEDDRTAAVSTMVVFPPVGALLGGLVGFVTESRRDYKGDYQFVLSDHRYYIRKVEKKRPLLEVNSTFDH